MAFMDQFRFGGQNDLLQMPGSFGSPFGQPNQQYGFGMFQSPWQQQGYNPQPGNMGFNPKQPGFQQPQNPSFNQPQNPTQNIGHNNPLFQVGQNPNIGQANPGSGVRDSNGRMISGRLPQVGNPGQNPRWDEILKQAQQPRATTGQEVFQPGGKFYNPNGPYSPGYINPFGG